MTRAINGKGPDLYIDMISLKRCKSSGLSWITLHVPAHVLFVLNASKCSSRIFESVTAHKSHYKSQGLGGTFIRRLKFLPDFFDLQPHIIALVM